MNKYAILLLALAINAQEVHVEEQYPLPLVGMAVYDDPVTHFASMGQLQRIASDITLTLARYLRSENFADFVIDQVSNTDGTPLDLSFDFVEAYYIGNLTPMIVAAYGAAQAFAPEIDFAQILDDCANYAYDLQAFIQAVREMDLDPELTPETTLTMDEVRQIWAIAHQSAPEHRPHALRAIFRIAAIILEENYEYEDRQFEEFTGELTQDNTLDLAAITHFTYRWITQFARIKTETQVRTLVSHVSRSIRGLW